VEIVVPVRREVLVLRRQPLLREVLVLGAGLVLRGRLNQLP
jgi:hypothetical protein